MQTAANEALSSFSGKYQVNLFKLPLELETNLVNMIDVAKVKPSETEKGMNTQKRKALSTSACTGFLDKHGYKQHEL